MIVFVNELFRQNWTAENSYDSQISPGDQFAAVIESREKHRQVQSLPVV